MLIHTEVWVYVCVYVCVGYVYFSPGNTWLSWKPASPPCKNTNNILTLIVKEPYFWKELNLLTLLFKSWSDVNLILVA